MPVCLFNWYLPCIIHYCKFSATTHTIFYIILQTMYAYTSVMNKNEQYILRLGNLNAQRIKMWKKKCDIILHHAGTGKINQHGLNIKKIFYDIRMKTKSVMIIKAQLFQKIQRMQIINALATVYTTRTKLLCALAKVYTTQVNIFEGDMNLFLPNVT